MDELVSNNKRTLYVGGLADEVTVEDIKASFNSFGDIIDINLPLDYKTQKHRGFAFVEFQLPEDAADAIDNLDNGEMLGKTIRVSLAKPMKFIENSSKPLWADDEYLLERQNSNDAGISINLNESEDK